MCIAYYLYYYLQGSPVANQPIGQLLLLESQKPKNMSSLSSSIGFSFGGRDQEDALLTNAVVGFGATTMLLLLSTTAYYYYYYYRSSSRDGDKRSSIQKNGLKSKSLSKSQSVMEYTKLDRTVSREVGSCVSPHPINNAKIQFMLLRSSHPHHSTSSSTTTTSSVH